VWYGTFGEISLLPLPGTELLFSGLSSRSLVTIPTELSRLSFYLLTPWNTVLLEKLTDSQLVKKFLAFYGN
jgi:hypothetical protein